MVFSAAARAKPSTTKADNASSRAVVLVPDEEVVNVGLSSGHLANHFGFYIH
jgi:hypothetical protein